jgi:hypothetical protein
MAPGRKKAFVLKRMASLVAVGSKRVAEKLSPRKKKRPKVVSESNGADKENSISKVSNKLLRGQPE